jgi:uncharacterized membrane protein
MVLNFTGIIIGAATFALIGVFHPIVIKCEYYFTDKIWPVFLITGISAVAISFAVQETVLSVLLAIFGFSCLWSIIELKHQKRRVEKGWFPKNPARLADDDCKESDKNASINRKCAND